MRGLRRVEYGMFLINQLFSVCLMNRPLVHLWECSQSGVQKIIFYRNENFFCFLLQIGCIPTDLQGVYWPATFACFCLARTKLDNYYCVPTPCVGLTLLNCYPTFFTEKEGPRASKTTVSVLRAKNKIICVAKARVMIDVSTLSESGLPQRHAVGTFDVCLTRPKNCPA